MKKNQLEQINKFIKEDRKLLKPSGKFNNNIRLMFDKDFMYLNADGKFYKIRLKNYSNKLYKVSLKEKMNYEISPDGYGISWVILDEDLSVKGLIRDGIKINIEESPFRKRKISFKTVKS